MTTHNHRQETTTPMTTPTITMDDDTMEALRRRFPTTFTVDGETFARAWRAVSVASGTDPERPAMYRTVLVEWYAEGVRLVAVDGYMLATAYVPVVGRSNNRPEPGELPIGTTVASDVDRRGDSLLKHIVAITKGEDAVAVELQLSVRALDLDGPQLVLAPELEASALCIDLEGVERVMLRSIEGEFPSWRALLAGLPEPQPTAQVTLSAEMHGRLCEIGKRLGATTVSSSMRDELGAVSFATNSWNFGVNVTGAYMPVRTS